MALTAVLSIPTALRTGAMPMAPTCTKAGYTTEVIAYSLATYCNSASSKGTGYKALGEATVVYSYYAKIYFQN